MRLLHSYVVARDYPGFLRPTPSSESARLRRYKAENQERRPNRRLGCRNRIEKGGAAENHLVYVMRVTGAMTFEGCTGTTRESRSRSRTCEAAKSSKPSATNIYSRNASGNRIGVRPIRITASLTAVRINPISARIPAPIVCWLATTSSIGAGPARTDFPAGFLNYGSNHISLLVGRNHKNNFPQAFVRAVHVAWIRPCGESQLLGRAAGLVPHALNSRQEEPL